MNNLKQNIFLIGPMGSGKTTIGRQLAKMFGLDFYDCDHELERLTGASVSLMDFFDIGHGGQLILLPIVILASLVDRLYAVLEEKGVRTAFVRLGWTLIIAATCIPIVQFEALGHLLVRYPELHLITLAMMLSVLLYTRKPLAQLPAFAWLNWPR